MQKNNKIYQLVNTHILMSMIQWNHAANLKWIWWELHRKLDLIRNVYLFFSGQIILSKNNGKTPKNTENHKIYQLEIMHILISMIQWIHVANLRWFWWELHRKLDLNRNLNIFSQASKNTEKTPKNTENHKTYRLEIMHTLISMLQWIYVANLKWFWWELHRKLDLIRNLNTEGTTPPTPPPPPPPTPPTTSWSYQ